MLLVALKISSRSWMNGRRIKKEQRMTDHEKALVAFERDLKNLIGEIHDSTTMKDPLWSRVHHLKQRSWQLRSRNRRMQELHRGLTDALNLLNTQLVQRRNLVMDLQATKNSTDPLP
jgi:chromosome segregation ATPase